MYKERMHSKGTFDLGEGFKRVMMFLGDDLDGFKYHFDVNYSNNMALRGMKLNDRMKKKKK